MKILLASSSSVACDIFSDLIKNHSEIEVVGFLTNKDKPAGRGQSETENEFASWAKQFGLPVFKVSDHEEISKVLVQSKADLVITVAFGQLINQQNLSQPKYGWLNVHFSLLPKYRGAAPVQHAILNGDEVTGISIFQMAAGLDTGPIFVQTQYQIPKFATTNSVLRELGKLSIPALKKAIADLENGIPPKSQADFKTVPTSAPKISKSDGHLDFSQNISAISAKYRALSKSPGVYAIVENQRIKFEELDFHSKDTGNISNIQSEIAQIVLRDKSMFIVAKDGLVEVIKLKPEGKSSMSGEQFLRGRANLVGKKLN